MSRCYAATEVDARLRSEGYRQSASGVTFIVYEKGYHVIMVQQPDGNGHVSADVLDQHVVDTNMPWLTRGLTSLPC